MNPIIPSVLISEYTLIQSQSHCLSSKIDLKAAEGVKQLCK